MKMKYLTPVAEIDSPDILIEELLGLKELIKHYKRNENGDEGIWEELDIRITILECILLNTLKESNDFNTDNMLKVKAKREWDEIERNKK